ncbi:MAG: serine/threonine-protein kinase [Sandaracinus sp.]
MSIETQRPYPGLVLSGKYRIERILGAGGMGEVYGATQLNLGRKVALKVLRPELAAQEGALTRFEREARVAAALDHPNAVEIYDFGKSQGYVYLAMELLSGAPLRAIVDEHLPLLPLPRVVRIVSEIAGVLVKAHAIGLVHRDLKPDNVFLEPPVVAGAEERVVVVDFGLAFIDGAGDIGRLTREGQVTGTPDYLSPEQSLGRDVGPPSDMYALGCMLYEMLSGRVPFKGAYVQVLTQQVYSVPPPLSSIQPDVQVPHALESLVMRLLDKDPTARPTAGELRTELSTLSEKAHERARAVLSLEGRAARMISAVGARPRDSALTSGSFEAEHTIAVVIAADGAALETGQAIGLSAQGLHAYVAEGDAALEGASAIWAPHASPEEVARLASLTKVPVLTDLAPGDTERLAALLRAGAAEALARPVRVEELAKKIARAIRKHHKR